MISSELITSVTLSVWSLFVILASGKIASEGTSNDFGCLELDGLRELLEIRTFTTGNFYLAEMYSTLCTANVSRKITNNLMYLLHNSIKFKI